MNEKAAACRFRCVSQGQKYMFIVRNLQNELSEQNKINASTKELLQYDVVCVYVCDSSAIDCDVGMNCNEYAAVYSSDE